MKFKITSLLLLFSITFSAQTICSAGFAGVYPCNKIDLMSQLTAIQLGGTVSTEANDIWGWTDPLNNKEYAIIGLTSHTAFVDISVPTSPVYLGKLPTASVNSIWRDIKVYNNHAFIVSEASGHGMQVFDLKRLRGVSTPQTFTADYHYTGFGRCHNIAIDEVNGYAYAIGTRTYVPGSSGVSNGGGPHIINIQTPATPVFVNEYNAQGYSHDAQIVVYNGPDTEHVGKQLYFGSNENKVVVVDVTNKLAPVLISSFTYTNTAYTHQGWLTGNHKYFLLGDEVDEQTFGFNTKTVIVDMSNLDAPVLKWNYSGQTAAIDHNGYTKGNDFYLANYRAGIRIMDISDIDNTNMNEIGFFDTYPSSNSNQFNGAWSVYPYFASGSIIISDIERGLFIVKKNAVLSNNDFTTSNISLYPNPTNGLVNLSLDIPIQKVEVFNLLGAKVMSMNNFNSNNVQFNVNELASGMYILLVNDSISQKLIVK
ncbi:choice-of-anchor B family protein [Flavobacterium sp.]|jgi:choice-of-anchor B domain-containing protein|uniref:choice-of-anchor B family protein n=1 Tax=Flavobacterium sp. TaxID=239 RepID=UPI002A81070C|nr:choice-of-anchor B family protein [Flavobacterium sp.]